MTSPEEPLPKRDKRAQAPSAWSICLRCGVVVPDSAIHEKWHDVIEDRVTRVRDTARVLRNQVAALEADVAALKPKTITGGV